VYFTNSSNGLTINKQIAELAIGGSHTVFDSDILKGYGNVDSPGMEFIRIMVKESTDKAIERYNDLKKELSVEEIMPELAMNGLGYQLLRMGKTENAIKIFKLNVEAFPESSNVYDSLGEAYMEHGDTDLAIKNYEKSLELDPENSNAVEKLKELRDR
jgi:tetratricopeptide (TPR) repeat protein